MATRDMLAGQQQLALEEQSERSLPPTYANYEWTGEGLCERSGSDTILYSYWDQPFACTIRRQHRDPEDFLPAWPMLDAPDYGRIATQKSVLAHHPRTLGTGIAAGPGAEKALAEYIATLPRLLVALAAPFGAQQWLLLDLFRRAPGLWKQVHRQTAFGRLGTLSLTLELFCAAGRTASRQRQAFADTLNLETRETLLHRFLKTTPPPALLAFLEQFPPGSDLLNERSIKSALSQAGAPQVSEDLTRLQQRSFSAILSETEWAGMTHVQALIDQGVPLPRLIATIKSGLRNLTASERPAALAGLKKIQAPQALQWWLMHWTTLAGRSRTFPAPPIPTAPMLTPLANAAQLQRESQRMRNGVDRYLADVLAGDLYFYHYDGHPAATICLAATGTNDWLLLEVLGEDGTHLQDGTCQEIVPSLLSQDALKGYA